MILNNRTIDWAFILSNNMIHFHLILISHKSVLNMIYLLLKRDFLFEKRKFLIRSTLLFILLVVLLKKGGPFKIPSLPCLPLRMDYSEVFLRGDLAKAHAINLSLTAHLRRRLKTGPP